jgi:predicted lipase
MKSLILKLKAYIVLYYHGMHIAVMESHSVDLRFEPNTIKLYRYSIPKARDERIYFVLISNHTDTIYTFPYTF